MRATEFIVNLKENLSRRGFLGGLGAIAAGSQLLKKPTPQPTTSTQPADTEPKYTLLSNRPEYELPLVKTAYSYGLKGPELAQFLGQAKHETWDFNRLTEKPHGKNYFARKYDPKYNPRIARILGNKFHGDGERYHGRGYIQLTGRHNYEQAGKALGLDLINDPDLAARPDIAAKIAIWYWNTRVKPKVDNFQDTRLVTKLINPGLHGLDKRHANFNNYLKVLG